MELTQFAIVKEFLTKKFPKKTDFIDEVIKDAVVIYLHLRRTQDQTTFSELEKNWIKRCSVELLNTEDYQGYKGYSENGFSVQKYESEISPSLIREVVPKVRML